MIHAWQYLGESGFDDLLKTAAEEREKKSRMKRRWFASTSNRPASI